MSSSPGTGRARFSRPRYLPGVELVSVSYRDRSFREHSHEEYVIGAVTAGAETLTVQGTPHLADAGSVLRLHPGEAHSNETVGPETLCYSVLYVPRHTLMPILGTSAPLRLRFDAPVTREASLYQAVCNVHAVLASPEAEKLEQESALSTLAHAFGVHLAWDANVELVSHAVVDQTRRYIDEHVAGNFGLHDLSQLTGVSPFHLVRTFKKSVGLSPLAYRNQRRINAARHLLLEGESIAQVALDLGYADQSHLSRHFQRIVGVSPRRYVRSLTDGS